MEKEPLGPARISGESDAEAVLLGRALAGDAEAAHWLVALFEEKHRAQVTGRMKSLGTGAHTNTIEDVFQETIIRLMDRLKAGELRDLPPGDRTSILKYFQRLCDGSLRDEVRARLSPVLARHKEEVPLTLIDPNAVIPGDPTNTEHLTLIRGAMKRLDPGYHRLLELYLQGCSHEEISRELGLSVSATWNQLSRLKEALREDVVSRSQTARLKYERDQAAKEKRWPPRSEIEAAVAELPPEIKDAVRFVHLERGSVPDLARKLGDRGLEKAQARIKQAYRSLAGRLKVSFPEAFEKAGL